MAKKSAVKPSPAGSPGKLPSHFLDGLNRHFGRLDGGGHDVGLAAARYVADGTDAEVLLNFGRLDNPGKTLCLAGVTNDLHWQLQQEIRRERLDLYYEGRDAPAEVWARFGEVLEAVNRASKKTANPPAGWPAWLAALVGGLLFDKYNAQSSRSGAVWPLTELAAVFAAAGLAGEHVVALLLDPQVVAGLRGNGYWFYGYLTDVFDGWPEFLAGHLDAVRQTLLRLHANNCDQAIGTLNRAGFDFAPIVETVVQLGTSSSKTVRESALAILLRSPAEAVPHAEKLLTEGDAARRHEAAVLLWKLQGERATGRLRQALECDPAERVKQTIRKLLAAPAEQAADSAREVRFEPPPLEVELGQVPFPEEAWARIRAMYQKAHQQAMQHYERSMAQWNSPNRPKWMTKPPAPPEPIREESLGELFEFTEGRRTDLPHKTDYPRPYLFNYGATFTDDSFAPPKVHLIHVVRLAFALNRLAVQHVNRSLWWYDASDLEAYHARCPGALGLREVGAAVATLPGAGPGMAASAYLESNSRYRSFCDWGPEAVWPAFVEHLGLLRDTLTGAQRPEARANAFRVLAAFPQLPPGFMTLLWDVALGESRAERLLAQAALRTVPDKAERILVALRDGRQAVRAAAAEWLGTLGDAAAVGPLKEAVRAEKQEAVKGVMMTALERLGADVNEFLDRAALKNEAEAGLAKKRPAGMAWVPLERLPAVRWKDTGEAVDPQVVRWWVVQGVQQKSPVPGPVLRRYLAMCRPDDTAALAKFVLSGWIARDTRTRPADEAAELAKTAAARQWKQYSGHQYWRDHYKSEENLYNQLLRQYSTELAGSAVNEKGMLALVAAAGDGDCVRMCEQYVRKWFGQRLSQAKCLVEVLAWVRHPLALQVLLSLANRFRTKAVRELAGQHVRAIAEREGWTIDELADRTIPDAGFARPGDEEGRPVGTRAVLALDYGPRRFTATLDDDLEPVVTNEEGKTVKNLPAPAKSDDAEKAKAARRAFTDAKKQVKDVVRRQTERLYESLCTQRAWRFDDWRRYLADHPVVGRLCVRLAWAAFGPGEGGKLLGCFRPLEDGSLTNEQDEGVTLPPETAVRLAHTANTPAALGEAWRRHFADYDVEPLFPQFGRETYHLPEAKRKETEVTDFRGYGLTAFQMRGRATKLGYARGEAEDGGWFTVYRKPFPSLGIQAEIEFTGNSLPEEERPAALLSLSFARIPEGGANRWSRSAVELGKVPAVLLSECYNDFESLAAEGTGFDPEWEKKSYY
jgi:hypothetical protein